jgi:hypothetical protein
MTRTFTGPIGAAISTPMATPASTSWMPDSTICAPSCKARLFAHGGKSGENDIAREHAGRLGLRSFADLRD